MKCNGCGVALNEDNNANISKEIGMGFCLCKTCASEIGKDNLKEYFNLLNRQAILFELVSNLPGEVVESMFGEMISSWIEEEDKEDSTETEKGKEKEGEEEKENDEEEGEEEGDIKNNFESMNSVKKSPKEIKQFLDEYIIGQDEAKRLLATEVFKHYLRVDKNMAGEKTLLKKNNILMTGESGTGKTMLAETLANILKVPFVIANATSITESGYVGGDVEGILTSLFNKADRDIEKTQRGIVFLDEIDKIAKKGENMSITRDVSGEGVQQALLKIVEGTVVGISPGGGRIHPSQKLIDIDTRNILFICGGAFVGIEGLVRKRLNQNEPGAKSMGFNVSSETAKGLDNKSARQKVGIDDLKSFGMIPEFLGRFPVICNLNKLDEDDMVQILNNDYGIIEEQKELLDCIGKKIEFDEEAIREIAKLSLERGVGARGLRGIVTSFINDIVYNSFGEDNCENYIITKEYLRKFFK